MKIWNSRVPFFNQTFPFLNRKSLKIMLRIFKYIKFFNEAKQGYEPISATK